MRRIPLLMALLCAALPGTTAAKPRYPYVAYVSLDQAPLRSGPGAEHYLTDLLERGTKVEVHWHDPGGWYAVRPLPGAYSWVPASHLEMTDEPDVAAVKKDGTVAWVGTRDGKVRNLGWQIEFKKGDLVEVLGARKMSLAEDEPEETCYKISPPSGEFRWLHSKHVTRRGADELAEEPPDEKPASDSAIKPAVLHTPVEARAPNEVVPTQALAPVPAEAGVKSEGGMLWKKRSAIGSDSSTSAAVAGAAPASAAKDVSAEQTAPAAGEESGYETRLRELEIELSLAVTREPAAWNLAPLRQQAAAHMDAGQTALERGRARLLVEKIDEFIEFAKRKPASGAAAKETATTAKNMLDTTAKPVGSGVRGTEFAPDIDPRYDGLGWLMPVHSQTRSTPSYALQDNDGKILQYITPAPGVNLNRYLRTQVGIYGQRGYVSHLRTPHLTAQRVVSLERHRR